MHGPSSSLGKLFPGFFLCVLRRTTAKVLDFRNQEVREPVAAAQTSTGTGSLVHHLRIEIGRNCLRCFLPRDFIETSIRRAGIFVEELSIGLQLECLQVGDALFFVFLVRRLLKVHNGSLEHAHCLCPTTVTDLGSDFNTFNQPVISCHDSLPNKIIWLDLLCQFIAFEASTPTIVRLGGTSFNEEQSIATSRDGSVQQL
mmetsp:Transcript_19282/g.32041  ORF Transcript_19282/g.32041 Transcript_19282/m.32041 type:complete len:200 (+) Transcript_19282:111-710(+)